MPIYEYRCAQCGHKLETLQKFSDAPLTTCPACGKEALSKLVSAAGFQLKGSGWYQTDFRSSGSKPAAKTEGGGDAAKTDPAATPSTGSDSSTPATSSTTTDKASAPASTPSPSTPAAS